MMFMTREVKIQSERRALEAAAARALPACKGSQIHSYLPPALPASSSSFLIVASSLHADTVSLQSTHPRSRTGSFRAAEDLL